MRTERQNAALRVALLAGSNLDLLEKPLVARLQEKGFTATIWNPGFNQYRQAILDPSSGLYGEKAEAILLHLETGDLFAGPLARPYEHLLEEIPAIVESAQADVASLVRVIAERLPSATVFLNTLSHVDQGGTYRGLEYNSGYSFRQIVALYNASLRELARSSSNVVVVDVEALTMSSGSDLWFDPRLWYLGRIPLSAHAHGLLASEYANFIAARWGAVRKCIVLDLDNTLWGGVIGEDGLTGIQLGHEGIGLAFVEFQRELLKLRQKGILLAICSKNNPEDAYEAIRKHTSMALREEDFAAVEINWNDKAENIREIARRLNIGVDSLVFIDDNPVERMRVREGVPEVAVPEWPADPCESTRALKRIAGEYFLKFDISQEDRGRGEMYRAQAERERLAGSSGNLEEFLRSLRMKIAMGRAEHETLSRVTELTQKTNQFNLTTRRYTEPEIAAMSQDPAFRVCWLKLEDRFGPNGMVGVLILRRESKEQWLIDTFLMSCRVIGRTVEEAFLGWALSELKEQGATTIVGEYIPTAKNGMVAKAYEKLGFTLKDSHDRQTRWTLKLDQKSITVPDWFEIANEERIAAQ